MSSVDVKTPNQENETLIIDVDCEGNSWKDKPKSQLPELKQISNEIQSRTQISEQKTTEIFGRMRLETDANFEAILKEIRSYKSISTLR